MKLRDFLTLKSGSGILLSGNVYNPYINYSWSQTLTVGGNQQIKDTGTAGLNLWQFFGQGCWFNGIDMQVTIPVNATIQTEIKRVNGVVQINTNTQNLTNYNVYSESGAKVYKDLYMFNRLLTQSEIEKYNNQPNQFFMDSLEDSSCILAMPMCEKDSFGRNYKSYLYTSFLINNIGLKSSTHSGTRIAQLAAGLLVQAGKTYLIKYSFIGNANITNFKAYIPPTSNRGTPMVVEIPVTNTNNGVMVTIPTTYTASADGFYCWLVVNGTTISVNFDEASIREISGMYPITNYLTTCRTNAQRLPYGLQTSGFKRDSNGLILSKSNFLEADGVGYGGTGWIPDISKPTTIECILDKKSINDFQLNGTDYLRIGVGSGNALYFRCGDKQLSITGTEVDSAYYIVVVLDGSIVTFYVNGVKNQTTNYVATLDITSFKLFTSQWNKPSNSSIRLFKVHNKKLTQEEVTKNLNKYQAQGLLK